MYLLHVEYNEERATIAIYDGIVLSELIDAITTSISLPSEIKGFKDTNSGMVLVPKFVCTNPKEVQQNTIYRILTKESVGEKPTKSVTTMSESGAPSNIRAPREAWGRQISHGSDIELLSIIKYMRIDGSLTDYMENHLINLVQQNDPALFAAYNNYLKTKDFQQLKTMLKYRTGVVNTDQGVDPPTTTLIPSSSSQRPPSSKFPSRRPLPPNFLGRPMTTAGGRRPMSGKGHIDASEVGEARINSTQAMLIGVIHDLEESSMLDKHTVSLVKTLILEENGEVFKVLNTYLAHIIDERELAFRIQRLTDREIPFMERPTSPLPRKDSLLSFINNLAFNFIRDRDDIQLLHKLIEDENEFVISAFDVFESDNDTENLLDTLLRIVEKYRGMGISRNSVTATGFYDGNIIVGRGKGQGGIGIFTSSGEEPEGSAAPDDIYISIGNPSETHFPPELFASSESEEGGTTSTIKSITIEGLHKLGILNMLKSEHIGMLRYMMNTKPQPINFVFNTFKMHNDKTLFVSTLTAICTKSLKNILKNAIMGPDTETLKNLEKQNNPLYLNAVNLFRESGSINKFISNIKEVISSVKENTKREKVNVEMTEMYQPVDIGYEIPNKEWEAPLRGVSRPPERQGKRPQTRGDRTRKSDNWDNLNQPNPNIFAAIQSISNDPPPYLNFQPTQNPPDRPLNENKEFSLNVLNIMQEDFLSSSSKAKVVNLIKAGNLETLDAFRKYMEKYDRDKLHDDLMVCIGEEPLSTPPKVFGLFDARSSSHTDDVSPRVELGTFQAALNRLYDDGKIKTGEMYHLREYYASSDMNIRGAWEAFTLNKSLSSLLDTLRIFIRINDIPPLSPANKPFNDDGETSEEGIFYDGSGTPVPEEDPNPEESSEKEEEEEEGEIGGENGGEAEKKEDINNCKVHMHMVMARYVKDGTIPYQDAGHIHELIESKNPLLMSAFEVFASTKDPYDFIENVQLIKNFALNTESDEMNQRVIQENGMYYQYVEYYQIIEKIGERCAWAPNEIVELKRLISRHDQATIAAFEEYKSEHDEEDFKETLDLILKTQQIQLA